MSKIYPKSKLNVDPISDEEAVGRLIAHMRKRYFPPLDNKCSKELPQRKMTPVVISNMKTLKDVEKAFEGRYLDMNVGDEEEYTLFDIWDQKTGGLVIGEDIKQFITSHITDLLEELRLEERYHDAPMLDYPESVGYNQAVSDLDKKIDKILNN